ncbi:MBL fold metallo-hydrolase [Streptomyces sp. Tue6028]|uniref:MBL fold metallo-hydrolase n=1 Tax=Streptomyces sp. Tue6028 TaxID=2036037 RepID=UPI003D75E067
MSLSHIPDKELAERPSGYQGPNLSPVGLKLIPHKFAEGVHALMANIPPKDNNGVIAGTDATLIVDAGITPDVSRQIQTLAAELSGQPLRYLINTTYHGDHTFGNDTFPNDVVLVSSRINKENMADLAWEKEIRSGNMYGDEKLLDAATHWRKPDVVFDGFAEIDLGGRTVQLWHFGPGNGPGDTIVYVPDTQTAWTGNYLCHAGVGHMLLQGGPEPYLASLKRMREALPDLRTIVPGHGPMGDGPAAIDTLIDYLTRLGEEVATSYEAGRTVEETMAACTDPWADSLDSTLAEAMAAYPVPTERAVGGMLELCRNLHRLNVLATYRIHEAAKTS